LHEDGNALIPNHAAAEQHHHLSRGFRKRSKAIWVYPRAGNYYRTVAPYDVSVYESLAVVRVLEKDQLISALKT
jgi:hypothetical protein